MLNFHSVPGFIKRMFPDFVWHIDTGEKIIYLTFDDGPIPEITEFVLATLKNFNAKATFFCVGDNIQKYPEIFSKIVNDGHSTGNHTYNHLKGWQVENKVYFENIEKFESVYFAVYSNPATLFRPPYGRIKTSQANHLKKRYKIIMWDVLTCDYDKTISGDKCLKNSIKNTKNGSIVVFHDSIKAEKNLYYVLPRYLAYFTELGFRFNVIT